MSAQTTYSRDPSVAYAGQLGDPNPRLIATRSNSESSANVAAGIFLKQDTEGKAKLLTAATERLAGVVLNTFSRNPGDVSVSLSGNEAYAPKAAMPMLQEGSAWVRCEQAMAVTDSVYVRFATGSGTTIGAVRKDPDGVAQVSTITPTAVNNAIYVLRVQLANGQSYTFEYVGDGSATATEIVTGFKTLMAADADFSAAITASGTSTLILTAVAAGVAFTAHSEGDGAMAVAATTPPAPTARLVKGARVDTPSTGAGVCKLQFSLNAENASF